MTLLEHLGELRVRLVWMAASVAGAAVPGWLLYEPLVAVLLRPARPYLPDGRLILLGPLEGFSVRLKVSIYIGFAIAFPIVLFHLWRFVAPGLRAQEKRFVIPFVVFGMVLFGAGLAFASYTLPQAFRFLIGPPITGADIEPLLAARQYLDFILMYLVVFGLAFQFPLVLMFLTIARVLSSRQLARYRRHVLAGLAVTNAFMTPPDVFSLGVLTVAMYVMYEACIWLSRLIKR